MPSFPIDIPQYSGTRSAPSASPTLGARARDGAGFPRQCRMRGDPLRLVRSCSGSPASPDRREATESARPQSQQGASPGLELMKSALRANV